MDFRRVFGGTHDSIHINSMAFEHASSFKFLGIYISEDLSWITNTFSLVKKAHQHFFFLRTLKKPPFHGCPGERSLLCYRISWPVMYGMGNALSRTAWHCSEWWRQLSASRGLHLLQTSRKHCLHRAYSILKNSSDPTHKLFACLPSGRCFRSLWTKTSRAKVQIFPLCCLLIELVTC